MARNRKTGLDYFPMDVDLFEDEKVELLSSEFGFKGEIIYIRLLCRIYKNGYSYKWGEDEALLFAKRVGHGVTGALVDEVVQGCVKRSLFDKRVFDAFKILTSKGIQERYLHICKQLKRAPEIDPRIDCTALKQLLSELNAKPPEIQPIIQGETRIIQEESTQRKGKERKGKEREWRERTILDERWVTEVAMLSGKSIQEVDRFCERFITEKRLSGDIEKYELESLTRFMVKDIQQPTKKQVYDNGKADHSNAGKYGKILVAESSD